MKTVIKLSFCFTLFLNSFAYAEVVTDGTMGAHQSLAGQMIIPQSLGTTAGNNLFQSFGTFNINTGESATFTGDSALKNVISRVTGGNPSTINGLLRSTIGNANFYFINPAGVTFGANAQVDVPAAFHVSAADKIIFPDTSVYFSATDIPGSTLTVADPIAFGFLNNQVADVGNIKIDGSTLTFDKANSVSLTGRNVDINYAWIKNPAGKIQIYATGDVASEFPLNTPVTTALNGRIALDNQSLLDVSGIVPGQLTLRSGELNISQSTLASDNYGDLNNTGISVDILAKTITLVGDQPGGYQTFITSNAFAQGNAGVISIKSDDLTLRYGSFINSNTFGLGHAGDIKIDTQKLNIDGVNGTATGITSQVFSNGTDLPAQGGNINIKSDEVSLKNAGLIKTHTEAQGNAGDIIIQANNKITINGDGNEATGIFSNSQSNSTTGESVQGHSGSIKLIVNNLSVENSGQINTQTASLGRAGDIIIEAKNVSVSGMGTKTGISSISQATATGKNASAGFIDITAERLSLFQGGTINSDTYSTSNAGNVKINSNVFTINGFGSSLRTGVFSNALDMEDGSGYATGHAGNIQLIGDKLDLSNSAEISSSGSLLGHAGSTLMNIKDITVNGNGSYASISSDAGIDRNSVSSEPNPNAIANAGHLTLNANTLSISNGGSITSLMVGTGEQGGITINADDISINRENNFFNATGIFTNSSTIAAYGKNLTILNGGEISSTSWNAGNAGDIQIEMLKTVIDGQGISAELGRTGIFSDVKFNYSDDITTKGGNIQLKTDQLNIMRGGVVSSSTFRPANANAGDINIVAKDILIDGQNSKTGIFSAVQFERNPLFGIDLSYYDNHPITGHSGLITVDSNNLTLKEGATINSSTESVGNAGTVKVAANNLTIDGRYSPLYTGIFSDSYGTKTGNAGEVIVTAADLALLNMGKISSSTWSRGAAGSVTINTGQLMISGADTGLFAAAKANSSGQAGNIFVTADKAIFLSKQGKISIQNNATISPEAMINPTAISISAPDIDMNDSEITTASMGNVNAGNISLTIGHQLTMDPSFIRTTANTGNGGAITINAGLINLQNSGFLTSVAGANGNGGNINVSADTLIMNNGVIQANALGGSGGDINLRLQALIPSQSRLVLGGSRVFWQPYITGFNVIQAASASGVNGAINVTSPQFDISGSISGLNSAGLVLPTLNRNPCQDSASIGSSLSRGGKGGIPANEAKVGFVPPTIELNHSSHNSTQLTHLSTHNSFSKGTFPCATLSP